MNRLRVIFHIIRTTFTNILSLGFIITLLFFTFYFGFAIFAGGFENEEIIRYIAEISFTLAGFTFISSIWAKDKKEYSTFELDVLSSCFIFLISGFMNLLYFGLKYLPQFGFDGNPLKYYSLVMGFRPAFGFIGALAFSAGLAFLIIIISLQTKKISDPNRKSMIEEFFHDFFGYKSLK